MQLINQEVKQKLIAIGNELMMYTTEYIGDLYVVKWCTNERNTDCWMAYKTNQARIDAYLSQELTLYQVEAMGTEYKFGTVLELFPTERVSVRQYFATEGDSYWEKSLLPDAD